MPENTGNPENQDFSREKTREELKKLLSVLLSEIKNMKGEYAEWKKNLVIPDGPLAKDKRSGEESRRKTINEGFRDLKGIVNEAKSKIDKGTITTENLNRFFAALHRWQGFLPGEIKRLGDAHLADLEKIMISGILPKIIEAKKVDTQAETLPADESKKVNPHAPTELDRGQAPTLLDDSWGVSDDTTPPHRPTMTYGGVKTGKLARGKIYGAGAGRPQDEDSGKETEIPEPPPTDSKTEESSTGREEPTEATGKKESKEDEERRAAERKAELDKAQGELAYMNTVMRGLKEVVNKDIAHVNLAPELSDQQTNLQERVLGIFGAIDRLSAALYNAERKKRGGWEEVDQAIKEVSEQYALTRQTQEDVTELKRKAKENYEQKIKNLEGLRSEAEETVIDLEKLETKVLEMDEHPLRDKFSDSFSHELDELSVLIERTYHSARDAEDMADTLLSKLKKSKKYPLPEEDNLLSKIVPEVRKNYRELQDKYRELQDKFISESARVEDGYSKEHEMLLKIYEKVLSLRKHNEALLTALPNWQGAWLEESSDHIPPTDAWVKADWENQPDNLSQIDQALKELQEPNPEAEQTLNDVFFNLSTAEGVEMKAREIAAQFMRDAFHSYAAAARVKLDEIREEVAEFKWTPQELAIKQFALEDVENKINSWDRLSVSSDVNDAMLNEKEVRRQIAQKNTIMKDLEDMLSGLRKDKERAVAAAKKQKAQKKKKKVPQEIKPDLREVYRQETPLESAALSEVKEAGEKPPEEPLRELVKEPEVKTKVEQFLETEGIIDIPPERLIRELSGTDYQELLEAIHDEDERKFFDILKEKIETFAPHLSEETEQRIIDGVYDALNQMIEREVTVERLGQDSHKLAKLKFGGKVIANIGFSLGVGAGVSATVASGGVGAALAGGLIVGGRILAKKIMSIDAAKSFLAGTNKTVKKMLGKDKAPVLPGREDELLRENAVDNICKVETVATMLSNLMREETAAEWVADRAKLKQVLEAPAVEMDEKAKEQCLETLKGPAQEQFFINALNYVNVAPEYRQLPPSEKVILSELITLTVGVGLRTDIEAQTQIKTIEEKAKRSRKSSWLADKLEKLAKIKPGGTKTKEHVAGHIWAAMLGGAAVRTIKELSPTARVVSGAVSGAAAGGLAGQTDYESAEQELLYESDKMIKDAEKLIAKYESLPIEEVPTRKLDKLVAKINDLQARVDSGTVRDKSTKLRVYGLAYRTRKIESAKAMEMERAEDVFRDLVYLAEKDNRAIDKKIKKDIKRFRSITKNREVRYMLGGALVGALYGLVSSGEVDMPEEFGTPDSEAVVEYKPAVPVDQGGYAPTEADYGVSPSVDAGVEDTGAADAGVADADTAEKISKAADTAGSVDTEGTVDLMGNEDPEVWGQILEQSSKKFIDNLTWLSDTVESGKVSDKFVDELIDLKHQIYQDFVDNGDIDENIENKVFDTLKKAIGTGK